MSLKINSILAIAAASVFLAACGADGEYEGTEYAPQMYNSVGYEPLNQIVAEKEQDYAKMDTALTENNSSFFNEYRGVHAINVRTPVAGTVSRQNYNAVTGNYIMTDSARILIYDLHKDSVNLAGRILKNPIVLDTTAAGQALLDQGKHLYIGYCAPCHGEGGKGDGNVGKIYGGVANLTGGAYKNLPEGHIFHVITHGKGRMWPHKSQLNPEERWKVVHYVKNVIQK